MKNIYIAYILWGFGLFIGGGIHRVYVGKFGSGFLQIIMFWFAWLCFFTIIGIFIAILFWGIWAIWWIVDVFYIDDWLKNTKKDEDVRLNNLNMLFELYQKGAISEEEFKIRKDIILKG